MCICSGLHFQHCQIQYKHLLLKMIFKNDSSYIWAWGDQLPQLPINVYMEKWKLTLDYIMLIVDGGSDKEDKTRCQGIRLENQEPSERNYWKDMSRITLYGIL